MKLYLAFLLTEFVLSLVEMVSSIIFLINLRVCLGPYYVSAIPVCFSSDEILLEVSSTTPEPPGLGYDLEFKIVDLGENFVAPRKGTPDYETLSNSIADSFAPLFKKIPGYKKVIIRDLKG